MGMHIQAMDVYLGSCFFFVFFSLVKLAFVKYMRQRLHVEKEHSVVRLLVASAPPSQHTICRRCRSFTWHTSLRRPTCS